LAGRLSGNLPHSGREAAGTSERRLTGGKRGGGAERDVASCSPPPRRLLERDRKLLGLLSQTAYTAANMHRERDNSGCFGEIRSIWASLLGKVFEAEPLICAFCAFSSS
jgi:hypothetical protein